MTDPFVPSHRRRTWWGLTSHQQRDVLRFARRGQPHPDAALWLAAVEWAREELRKPLWQLVLAPLLLDPMAWAERRAARRIMRTQGEG